MRHNSPLLGTILAVLAFSGCSLGPQARLPAPAARTVEKTDPSPAIAADAIATMARLSQGTPAEQAEVFQAAKEKAETDPTTHNRLKYALALATPDHGNSDNEAASQRLSALLATPDLLPAERMLVDVMLKNVVQRQVLQAENKRLQADAARLARERTATNSRRLQEQIEENERLKKELADAQAKLDEIARIERATVERNPPQKTP